MRKKRMRGMRMISNLPIMESVGRSWSPWRFSVIGAKQKITLQVSDGVNKVTQCEIIPIVGSALDSIDSSLSASDSHLAEKPNRRLAGQLTDGPD
jgi:hypothetical protein